MPNTRDNDIAIGIGVLFLGLFTVNLVILAFDFPRTTSLTLFFFAAALVMGLILLFTFQRDLWPEIAGLRPGVLTRWPTLLSTGRCRRPGFDVRVVLVQVRFDYWEVRGNELLHHHGFLANLERFPPPTCGWRRRSTTSSSFSCSNPAG